MVLRKDTFRYIEKELYDYHHTVKHLEELRADIMHSTPIPHEIRSTEVSDPTFHIVSMLTTNKLKLRMEEIVLAIEFSIVHLAPESRELLEDKYWTRPYLTWQQASDLHHVDVRTVFRWRSAFVCDIARRLGSE